VRTRRFERAASVSTLLALATITALFAAAATAAAPPSVDCESPPQSTFPFCDPSLDIDKRVDDLVGRLSDEEVINQTYVALAASRQFQGRERQLCVLDSDPVRIPFAH
jgi:hypothetical protein